MSRHSKLDMVLENLVIEAVAAEGKAIAHTPEGQVVFVGFAVPGDVVDVRLVRKKKAWMEGTIIKLVRLPKGARILNSSKLFFEAGQSASLTVKIGDEADDDRYFAAATIGASATSKTLEANVFSDAYEFPKEQWVMLTTGGAALASGKKIAFEIFFTKYG